MAILRVFNRFVSSSLEVIFIPVHQRMLKVRPTSPSFVLVWNTPAAYGIHILKCIAKILKDYNGKPARFVKQNCYEREPGTVTNLLCPVVRTPVSANPGLNFNPGFFFFLSKAQLRIIFSILFRVSNHRIVGKES